MEKLQYSIDDKTIAELLGVQNFTTSESAILELVKNAYDADAKNLLIEINKDKIEILDDGKGMDENDIRKNWMYVGKSDKGYKNEEGDRVLAGSKGVGRFALAKLGNKAIIHTKKIDSNGFKWSTNWEESYIEKNNSITTKGTKIVITELREKWNDTKIKDLTNFISRTYNDVKMKIKINGTDIEPFFPNMKLGINCLSIIDLKYKAEQMELEININSDEFLDTAKKYCKDYNFKLYKNTKNMFEEFDKVNFTNEEREDLKKCLINLGSFCAKFYFSNNPTSSDVNDFLYKYSKMKERISSGVVLYRNAFSISSFEGKKDWLTLGKRSRRSPAAASHRTGQWRVKENQISGKVEIDKKINVELKDLANRQGLEENKYYDLFVKIILFGIDEFESFRQTIIRKIKIDNSKLEEKTYPKTINKIVLNKTKEMILTYYETKKVKQEFDDFVKRIVNSHKRIEDDYRYDVRILNALSTIGLKASSIAHEMKDYNNSVKSVDLIIKALKKYDMWNTLSSTENTQKEYQNVPSLLNKVSDKSKKLASFIEVMLTNIEKNRFKPFKQNIKIIMEKIIFFWKNNYAWINIKLDILGNQDFFISEDILRVIFDNLILNSIQQNYSFRNSQLSISIVLKIENNFIDIEYTDYGNGLAKKYLSDPEKILKVHETTRQNGHGLGMWIVNNTILDSGGKIDSIDGKKGFKIKFTIGEKYDK